MLEAGAILTDRQVAVLHDPLTLACLAGAF
jgi:hypothetical protein